jgi:hypothetical protein
VLFEWAGEPRFAELYNPFENEEDWALLASVLEARGEEWQFEWAHQLEAVIMCSQKWKAFRCGKRAVRDVAHWLGYRFATATPAEKSEALYRAIRDGGELTKGGD